MIDLITVVFRDEIPLLRIQARSIAEYVTSDELNSIIVVVNDSADVADLIDTAWWEQYRDRVKIVPRSFESRNTGWESQQLCKLLAAANADTEYSIVLDAKTWYVTPLELTKRFNSNGLPVVGSGQVKFVGISDSTREFVEKFFKVDTMQWMIGPAGVPFFFHTKTVKDMIASIDNFTDWFQTNVKYPNLITEFLLYSGYVKSVHGVYSTLYDLGSGGGGRPFMPINVADYDIDKFDREFEIMKTDPYVLTASIHRKLYAQLSPTQLEQWQQFLIDRKLTVTKFTF